MILFPLNFFSYIHSIDLKMFQTLSWHHILVYYFDVTGNLTDEEYELPSCSRLKDIKRAIYELICSFKSFK